MTEPDCVDSDPEAAERLEAIQDVKEALASIDRGEGRPIDEAFDDLERSLSSATEE